jgi:lipoprotein-anchoring transpeptidase ErfK/SrfK
VRRLSTAVACLCAATLLTSCVAAHNDRGAAHSARPAGSSQRAAAASATTPSPSRSASPAQAAAAAPAAVRTPAPPNACAHNQDRKLVLVDVSQQHLWLCQGTRTSFSSAVTTGAVGLPYDATPTGSFEIQEKDRNRTLTLLGGQQFTVKYWIPFQGPLFGFHDAPWQTMPFGSQKYRTKGSHGCVHLPLATIRHLYRWAQVGTPVRIRH